MTIKILTCILNHLQIIIAFIVGIWVGAIGTKAPYYSSIKDANDIVDVSINTINDVQLDRMIKELEKEE